MNSKNLLITIVVIIVVLIAGALLWKGNYLWQLLWQGTGTAPGSSPSTGGTTGTPKTGTGGQTGGQVGGQTGGQTTGGTIGKMTDEIYIEILAQSSYYAQKDPNVFASHMKGLYQQYGITEENVKAYGEALAKDPQRAQTIAQKYMQRALELRNAGK